MVCVSFSLVSKSEMLTVNDLFLLLNGLIAQLSIMLRALGSVTCLLQSLSKLSGVRVYRYNHYCISTITVIQFNLLFKHYSQWFTVDDRQSHTVGWQLARGGGALLIYY